MSIKDFVRPTLFVSITKVMREGENGKKPNQMPVEDWARGYWLLNAAKKKKCEWLAAVNADEIVGMWEIDAAFGWKSPLQEKIKTRNPGIIDPRRNVCRVIPNSDRKFKKFIGQRMSSIEGLGSMSGPVRYNI